MQIHIMNASIWWWAGRWLKLTFDMNAGTSDIRH